MPCETWTAPNGDAWTVCLSGRLPQDRRPPCRTPGCNRPSPYLCDYPIVGPRGRQTCDRPICTSCRVRVREGIDYCQEHKAAVTPPTDGGDDGTR